tara:strand:- start:483 stop:1160 length:678 start_codon:yes stop_codon:yes gene_type:complete
MKKIALCFNDFTITRNSISIFNTTYLNLLKNILYNNEFHIFIHIWEPTNENNQKNLKLNILQDMINLYKPEEYKIEFNKYSNANQSHWYSHDAVLELVNNYSNKNNIQYDLVFITKPDCIFTTRFNLDTINIQDTLYVSNWEKQYGIVTEDYLNSKGLCYYWCFGNMHLINKLKNIKNHINSQKTIEHNFYTYILNNNISYTPIFFLNKQRGDDFYIFKAPNSSS